jgi:hypothetical protein
MIQSGAWKSIRSFKARLSDAVICFVAACILVFASAVRDLSIAARHSTLAAYLIGFLFVEKQRVEFIDAQGCFEEHIFFCHKGYHRFYLH